METEFCRQWKQEVLPRRLLWLCPTLFLAAATVLGVERQGPTVTNATRSKVDVGITIKGAWGTFINGKSYQQMPLDTYKGTMGSGDNGGQWGQSVISH